MDFLKEILGDDLFSKVEAAINDYNGKDENKDKQVKLGNLGSGDYVSKAKSTAELQKIQALLDGKTVELDTANTLIANLKKSNKGNEDLQGKINAYEDQVQQLQNELQKTRMDYAIKFALQDAKALDVDYLTFKLTEKLKENGESLELDDNENIKGWEDKLSSLKTQFPNQFESSTSKKINEHKLEQGDDHKSISKAELMKMSYQDRANFYNENKDEYESIMKGD